MKVAFSKGIKAKGAGIPTHRIPGGRLYTYRWTYLIGHYERTILDISYFKLCFRIFHWKFFSHSCLWKILEIDKGKPKETSFTEDNLEDREGCKNSEIKVVIANYNFIWIFYQCWAILEIISINLRKFSHKETILNNTLAEGGGGVRTPRNSAKV